MAAFNYSALQPSASTPMPYNFAALQGPHGVPVLNCLPATTDNKPFMNDTLRRSAARNAGRRKAAQTTPESIIASRNEDKELFAKHCVKSWNLKNAKGELVEFKDAEGNAVEFSEAEVLEFFQAIPDWVFDDFRVWLLEITNWVPATDTVDGAELGKS